MGTGGGVGGGGWGLDVIGMVCMVLGHERLLRSLGGKAVSEHPATPAMLTLSKRLVSLTPSRVLNQELHAWGAERIWENA